MFTAGIRSIAISMRSANAGDVRLEVFYPEAKDASLQADELHSFVKRLFTPSQWKLQQCRYPDRILTSS
jgi:hypothetical protein